MASSELDLAKQYLALTQRVHSDKMEELKLAKELVEKLQHGLVESTNDIENAKEIVRKVERRLDVVEIIDDDEKENMDPIVGVPVCPMTTSPRPRSGSGSSLDTHQRLIDECMRSQTTIPLPVKLRRSLKRYKRKIVSFLEQDVNHEEEPSLNRYKRKNVRFLEPEGNHEDDGQ